MPKCYAAVGGNSVKILGKFTPSRIAQDFLWFELVIDFTCDRHHFDLVIEFLGNTLLSSQINSKFCVTFCMSEFGGLEFGHANCVNWLYITRFLLRIFGCFWYICVDPDDLLQTKRNRIIEIRIPLRASFHDMAAYHQTICLPDLGRNTAKIQNFYNAKRSKGRGSNVCSHK